MKKLFLIFLILAALVNAQEASLIKEAPDTIKVLDVLNVEITVYNPENVQKSYLITESIPQGFTLIEPSQADEVQKRNALSVNILKWNINVQPQSSSIINYKIKPEEVGEYILSPTNVLDQSTNSVFLSEPKQIIVTCAANNKCEGKENKLTCPEDCGDSLNDGICEYKADGICDPDCEREPDCDNTKSSSYLYIILIIIVLVIIVIFVRWLTKSKEQDNPDINPKSL